MDRNEIMKKCKMTQQMDICGLLNSKFYLISCILNDGGVVIRCGAVISCCFVINLYSLVNKPNIVYVNFEN